MFIRSIVQKLHQTIYHKAHKTTHGSTHNNLKASLSNVCVSFERLENTGLSLRIKALPLRQAYCVYSCTCQVSLAIFMWSLVFFGGESSLQWNTTLAWEGQLLQNADFYMNI